MKKTLLLAFALAAVGAQAQTPQELWLATYPGPNDSKAITDMKMDAQGFTYVCGQVGPSSGPSDAYVAKYSPSGQVVWQRSINIANFGMSEGFRRLIVTNDAIYAGGFMYTTSLSSSQDFFLAKLELNGNMSPTWNSIGRGVGVRYLSMGNADTIADIALVGSDIVAVGNSENANGNSDFVAYRLETATGNPASAWPTTGIAPGLRIYDSTGEDNCKRVRVDANGNVYIAGDIQNGTTKDFGVVKIASNGNFSSTWPNNGHGAGVRRYDSPNNEDDTLADLEVSGSTAVLFGSSGNTLSDFRVVSYNSVGTLVANTSAGTNSTDFAQDGVVLSDGDYVVTGNLGNDIGTIRFTSAGARSGDWPDIGSGPGVRRIAPSSGSSRGVKLATTIDNQIVVTARVPGSVGFNIRTAFYSNSGALNLNHSQATIPTDSPVAITSDQTGRVYVAGNQGDNTLIVLHYGLEFGLNSNSAFVFAGEQLGGSTANLYENDSLRCDFFPDSIGLNLLLQLTREQDVVNQNPAMVKLFVDHMAERLGLAWNVKVRRRSTNRLETLGGGLLTGTDVTTTAAFFALGEDMFDANGLVTILYEAAPVNDEDPSQDGWLMSLDQLTLRYYN